MTALAADTDRRNNGSNIPPDTFTAANNQVFYQGSAVLIKADGLAYVAVAYAAASGGTVPGCALFALDTTIAANQGRSVVVQPGTFGDFDISGTAAVTDPASRLTQIFFENDNTISGTNQGGTLTGGARLHSISADGLTAVVQFEVLR